MSGLLPVMQDFGMDYLRELANEQPDLVDLLILTMHLEEERKRKILMQLTEKIKECYSI